MVAALHGLYQSQSDQAQPPLLRTQLYRLRLATELQVFSLGAEALSKGLDGERQFVAKAQVQVNPPSQYAEGGAEADLHSAEG